MVSEVSALAKPTPQDSFTQVGEGSALASNVGKTASSPSVDEKPPSSNPDWSAPAPLVHTHRTKAGTRLKAILEEEKRTEPLEDTEDSSEVETDDTGTSGPGESRSSTNNSQCCCVCSVSVTKEDIVAQCRGPQCQAVVHHSCGGYTAKGAKRAKFICPSCHARKILAKPTRATRSQPQHSQTTTAATAQAQGAMTVGAVSGAGAGAVSGTKCLCDHYSFCENCLNLQSLARRLTESLNATRKENQALNLHILKLEERIQALERSAKPIERLEAIERDVSNLKSTLFPPSSQGTSWARVAGRRQPRGSRPPPTSAPSMRNPTSASASASASASSGQASRRSSGNRRRSSNPFSDSYRIIWGTRFTTSVATVRSTVAEILKERYISNDVHVVRSVKRREDRARRWFTVMAPPDILTLLDSSWPDRTSSTSWMLLKAFGPTQRDPTSSHQPVSPTAEPGSQSSSDTITSTAAPVSTPLTSNSSELPAGRTAALSELDISPSETTAAPVSTPLTSNSSELPADRTAAPSELDSTISPESPLVSETQGLCQVHNTTAEATQCG